MLTLDLTSDGSPGDVAQAMSLEFNLGVRVTLNGQPWKVADIPGAVPVTAAEAGAPVVAGELHPVLEKDVVQTPATPIPSFQDLLNQQVPSAEVTESSP